MDRSLPTGEYHESSAAEEIYVNTGPGSGLCARTSQLSASRCLREINESKATFINEVNEKNLFVTWTLEEKLI